MRKIAIYLNRLEKIPLWKKLLVLIGVILLIWAIYGFLFLKPRYSEWIELQKRLTKLKKDIGICSQRIKELEKVKSTIESKKIEFSYAKALLPESTEEVERLLSDIEKIGKDIGIEFLLFIPTREERYDFYAKKYITLNLLGSFHDLLRFYNELFKMDRLVTLEKINLTPKKELSDKVILVAKSEIAIYRMLKESEIKKRRSKRRRR